MRKLFVSIFLILALCNTYNLQAQTLKKYAQQRKQELLEKQRVEQEKYDALCKNCTLEKCKEYLSLYPNGKYVSEVSKRIEDIEGWNNAKSANTIDGYQSYIENSQYKFFEHNAKEAIVEIESIEEWKSLKATTSLVVLRSFINKYPNSSCIDSANRRIHELKGIEYYKQGRLADGFREFTEAGGRNNIDISNRRIYDECLEFSEYKTLKTSTDTAQLIAFLTKYPSSPYYNDISNRIAIQKAKDLKMYSGEYSFNDALSYAKDATTRATVNAYIESCKKSYVRYKRMFRRKANGGLFNFGIEPIDIAINPSAYGDSDSDFDMVMYWNMGASLKIGNFRSPVQLELGVKPGVLYTLWYGGATSSIHMPVYARLKINIANASSSSKFYIDGVGLYNYIRGDAVESKGAWQVGCGVAWRHWDWRILYYKQDFDTNFQRDNYVKDKMLGSSIYYYF